MDQVSTVMSADENVILGLKANLREEQAGR